MLPRIHCITAAASVGEHPIERIVEAGVDAVQLRAKHLTDDELLALARDVVDRLDGRATVIVNDRLDIALAAGADGVHLGLHDLPVRDARRLSPPGFVIGGTCRNAEQARRAALEGADYVGVGPVYATTSKQGLPGPVGVRAVAEVAAVLPAVAISGVTLERIPEVMAAGAHGVAVIAAIADAADPVAASRALADSVARHCTPQVPGVATTPVAR